MNLAVFGASGRVGAAVLSLAQSRGWSVRALVRPSSHCKEEARVEIIRGSLESPTDVLVTLHGAHAVLCLYGPRSAQSIPFCAQATLRIIAGMQVIGLRRLLCLTGAMVGALPSNVSLALRAMAAAYRYWCPELAADASEQERVVIDSQVETPPQARILQGERALVFAAVAGKTLPNAEIVVMPNASGKVDLAKMLQELARRGVNELHVEGGFKLNGSLVREGCVDEFLIYLNPSLLGGTALGMLDLPGFETLEQRLRLSLRSLDRVGEDLRILARPA